MNYDDFVGAPVFDKTGDKMGKIADLYYTDDEKRPIWATVKSGLFGLKKHFVPLTDIDKSEDGFTLRNVTKDMVQNAPSVDDDDETSEADDARLRNYYKYNDEAMNGREEEDVEAMPNVELSEKAEEQKQEDEARREEIENEMDSRSAATEPRLLRKYIVTTKTTRWDAIPDDEY